MPPPRTPQRHSELKHLLHSQLRALFTISPVSTSSVHLEYENGMNT